MHWKLKLVIHFGRLIYSKWVTHCGTEGVWNKKYNMLGDIFFQSSYGFLFRIFYWNLDLRHTKMCGCLQPNNIFHFWFIQHGSCHFLESSIFYFYWRFCWGFLGHENLWEIQFSSKNYLKEKFSNSPLWSLLTTMIFEPFSFLTFLQNVLKASKDLSLCFNNNTHVNLKKSSTITNPYLLPLRLAVLTGSSRYMWRSSSDLVVNIIFFE